LLTASFRHIRGIGPLRERQLWLRGIRSWDEVPEGAVLSPVLDVRLRQGIAESRNRLAEGDLGFFARALPAAEHFRILPHAIEDAGFVDVETAPDLTVIGILDRDGPRSFWSGYGAHGGPASAACDAFGARSSDLDEFPSRAAAWKMIVTFNGSAFDLPHLIALFPAWEPPAAHLDLCHAFRRAGERGSLKEIEERLGLHRPPHLRRLCRADAAWLWQAERKGDRAALQRLVEYNLRDAFHLRPLAEMAYNLLVRRLRMPAPELPVTDRGALLYDVSKAVARACASQG
jgi:uncharacterized protein